MALDGHVNTVFASGNGERPRAGIHRDVFDGLAHHRLIVRRACGAAMNGFGKARAPGQLKAMFCRFPDVLQVTHAITVAIGGVHHCAVDGGILQGSIRCRIGAEVKLIIAIAAFGGELAVGTIDRLSAGALGLAEGKRAISCHA